MFDPQKIILYFIYQLGKNEERPDVNLSAQTKSI
jgi:hypothetical protein